MKRIISLAILLCFYIEIYACDCVPRSLDNIIESSEVIVVAKIIQQESSWIKSDEINFGAAPDSTCYYSDEWGYSSDSEKHYCTEIMTYQIVLEKIYKGGIIQDTIFIYSSKYSNCRVSLKKGESYLFCMSKSWEKDIYGLSLFTEISSCNKIIPNKPNPSDERFVKMSEELSYIANRFKR